LAFVTRTDLARFVDLCWSIDGLVEQSPDHGKAVLDCGFHLSNRCVHGSVGSIEERRNLVDTEQRIGVEDEREKHLAAGEALLMERRSIGIYWLEIAASAPDTVNVLPGHDTLITATRTRGILPELLESMLDPGIKRFSVDFDDF
jgi:hypothetical protein